MSPEPGTEMRVEPGTVEAHKSPLRWWILLLLFLAMTINIMDRQVLSLVAPVLMEKLHLTDTEYGTIVFFFLLGMAVSQIPVGSMLDRIGVRLGYSLIFLWWSIANMLHMAARTVEEFSALRFLLGVGESGTYSGGVKVIGQWFSEDERAMAAGLFNSGSLAGAIIAPPLIVFLMLRYGWEAAFLVPSVAGLLWLIPWRKIYWEPSRHPGLSAAARMQAGASSQNRGKRSGGLSIRRLLKVRAVWGVVLMRAFGAPVTNFYWYWLPEYLKHSRGMSMEMIGLSAWLPFFSGGVGNIGGGWFSDKLIARGWSVNKARKTAFILSIVLCLLAVLVPLARSTVGAMALICIASLGINAFASNLMALSTDLFPQFVLARVSGLTGVGDGVMSMTSMLLTGIIVEHFSYRPIFIAAGIYPVISLAALLFLVGHIRRIPEPELSGESPAN